ncbi:MAG: amidohydrolase family protein [Acidimicrobiales bacterium]|nr:amidohydrolase family protein [Acidimicrobiales bacterium]
MTLPVHDADNHYYEALDAFTRHLDPALGPRCVQWCEIDGRKYHVIGGRVSRAVRNATFDPVSKPGVLASYFRGNADQVDPIALLRDSEPIRPAYRDRDARLAAMDEQGLASCWMFPTLGMIYEALLRDDPVAVCHTFRAFNRWVEEDWGFAYRDRIFAAPYLTLADADWAVEELTWALEHDARTIVMLPAAPVTVTGRRSPFDPAYDPFWSLVNESGVTVVLHAGDSGLSSEGYAPDGFAADFQASGDHFGPSIKFFAIEQAVHYWMLAMVLAGMPMRYPNIRFASVENGAEFLPDVFRKLRSVAKKIPGWFPDDPVELFTASVWINPFWEDDIAQVVEWVGADRVLFGSDWPHIEGMPMPLDYLDELTPLDDAQRRLVLHDNALALTNRRPT